MTADRMMVSGERHWLLQSLQGGTRRSIGRAEEAVRHALADPALITILVQGMQDADPVVRMRAADALEKISARSPASINGLKREILQLLPASDQQEVQWHLAQMVPRLGLRRAEARMAARDLLRYLESRSAIVRTCAMQALSELALLDPSLRRRWRTTLADMTKDDSPAVRARARKLLPLLQVDDPAAGVGPEGVLRS